MRRTGILSPRGLRSPRSSASLLSFAPGTRRLLGRSRPGIERIGAGGVPSGSSPVFSFSGGLGRSRVSPDASTPRRSRPLDPLDRQASVGGPPPSADRDQLGLRPDPPRRNGHAFGQRRSSDRTQVPSRSRGIYSSALLPATVADISPISKWVRVAGRDVAPSVQPRRAVLPSGGPLCPPRFSLEDILGEESRRGGADIPPGRRRLVP